MYLFDSNILIDLTRRKPPAGLNERFESVPLGSGATSSLVLLELRRGTARNPDPDAAWESLERGLLKRLTVLDFTKKLALATSDIDERLRRRGRTLPEMDLMIGVTALEHGLIMVTRNVRDFTDIPGLKVDNWVA
ncbi:MAG: type II toxin-antitoxin system VapC family toxin [Planctomycetota bacterium]